jgi:hypothetical protein
MIFTVEEGVKFTDHYIKDDKGYIIGSVRPTAHGWVFQSCDNKAQTSWSNPELGGTKMEAVNACIADYIARRME